MRPTSARFSVFALIAIVLSVGAVMVSEARAAPEYYSPVAIGASPIAENSTYVSPTMVATTSSTTTVVSNENPEMGVAVAAPVGLGLGGWLAVLAVILLIAGAGWLAWRASAETY